MVSELRRAYDGGEAAAEVEAVASTGGTTGAGGGVGDPLAALHEAEARYRLAGRATDDVVWDYDLAAGVVHWNEALTRRFGHAPEGMATPVELWEDWLHPDDRARCAASLSAAIDGATEYWAEEYRLRRADGSYADVLDRGYVIRDEGGHGRRMVGAILDLSERKRAEAALRESEARFRHMADHAPVMVWMTEADGLTSYLSRSWYEFTGQTPETGLGRAWTAALHPDDLKAVGRVFAEGASAHRPFDLEFRLRRADGEWRWVFDAARPRFDDDGRFLGYVGSLIDITERRAAEEALRASEERLRLAQEAAGLGTFAWALNEPVILTSDMALRIIGIDAPSGKVAPQQILAIVHPDDCAAVRTSMARAVAGDAPERHEYRIVRPSDGDLRWVSVTGRDLAGGDGELLRRIGVIEDITDRKLAEARLRESEENYRYTVELSPQLAWTADPDGSNVDFKRPFSDFPGLALPKGSSDWTDQLTHPEDRSLRRREWEISLRSGRPYDAEFRVRRDDGGYRWVRARGWPRRDEMGRIVKWYGVTEDVDDRKRAEQRSQRLQDELAQVARVSAMGTLASALAHELNQPLTAVANYMAGSRRLLEAHGADAIPMIAEALDSAGRAAVQAGEIVRRLRDLVAKGRIDKQPVDLPLLIHETCEATLGEQRDRAIGLSVEYGPDTRTVLADRIQIQQVFANLLRNAAEAMARSGVRVITIVAMPFEEGQVVVRVEDSGPGVPPEAKQRIFSPFVSTKATGMGVGLSICRSIVEAHGGQLWVEDTPAGGAAFCFTLARG